MSDNKQLKTIQDDFHEILEKMMRDDITGPVILDNAILLNLRITGTGLAPRQYHGKEIMFNRPAGVFLSNKFLEMCNGLPITWEHAPNGLNFDNWKEYIVGAIIKPYIKNSTEVWGIGRIHSLDKLEQLYGGVESTSPFVTSKNIENNNGIIEEDLINLNHVALTPRGFWDQKKEEAPIKLGDITFKEESKMANEELVKKDPNKVDSAKVDSVWDQEVIDELRRLSKSEDVYEMLSNSKRLLAQEFYKKANPKDVAKKIIEQNKSDSRSEEKQSPAEESRAKENPQEKKDSVQKVDNKSSKDLELTEIKKDNDSEGGIMADEKKQDEAMTQVGAEEKKDKCDEPDKKKVDAVETPLTEKKDDDDKKDDAKKDEEKKEDAEEEKKDSKEEKKDQVDEVGALRTEIASLKAELEKIKTAEKGEGQKFTELGTEHETLTADDDEKEELVDAVSELADSAHAEIKIVRPNPKRYESKFDYVRRFLSHNKDLVDNKHKFLIDKVDSATFGVAKEAVGLIAQNVKSRTMDLNKKSKGAIVAIHTPDGAITDVNYGRRG